MPALALSPRDPRARRTRTSRGERCRCGLSRSRSRWHCCVRVKQSCVGFVPGLRRHGVTEQQWRVLRALAHSGPMEVTELAGATFLLPPSLSRILPDMETRALIRRTQADADLRRSVISLEPKGLRLIATHAPYSERDLRRDCAAPSVRVGSAQLFVAIEGARRSAAKSGRPGHARARVQR